MESLHFNMNAFLSSISSKYNDVIEHYLEHFARSQYPGDMCLQHDHYNYYHSEKKAMATVHICDREGARLATIWMEYNKDSQIVIKGKLLKTKGQDNGSDQDRNSGKF